MRNVRATLDTEYVPFNVLLAPPHERVISICGFGPSLKETYGLLQGDVWACNGAHDWLIAHGVIPKYGMFWDAAEVIAKFVHPHPDVVYLVGSRCHRSVFKALEGYKVVVWHSVGDQGMDDMLCEYQRAEPMCGHGSAAATTAMSLCTNMGYRQIRMFGADSSYPGEHTHAKQSIVSEVPLDVWMDGRRFKSTSWLAGQVEDFQKLGPMLRDQGCNIEFYGDGLLQHCARINGFKVHTSTEPLPKE